MTASAHRRHRAPGLAQWEHVQILPGALPVAWRVPERERRRAGRRDRLPWPGRHAAQFSDLMRRRGPQHFYSFDLVWLNGSDRRGLPLLERKRQLREKEPPPPPPLLYVDHVVGTGVDLFEAVVPILKQTCPASDFPITHSEAPPADPPA